MSNNKIPVRELEQLAKIELTGSERADAEKYMEFLEADFSKLADVDTSGVKPLIHGIELANIFRDDIAIKNIDRETLLKTAPEHEDGFFKVPKTID